MEGAPCKFYDKEKDVWLNGVIFKAYSSYVYVSYGRETRIVYPDNVKITITIKQLYEYKAGKVFGSD